MRPLGTGQVVELCNDTSWLSCLNLQTLTGLTQLWCLNHNDPITLASGEVAMEIPVIMSDRDMLALFCASPPWPDPQIVVRHRRLTGLPEDVWKKLGPGAPYTMVIGRRIRLEDAVIENEVLKSAKVALGAPVFLQRAAGEVWRDHRFFQQSATENKILNDDLLAVDLNAPPPPLAAQPQTPAAQEAMGDEDTRLAIHKTVQEIWPEFFSSSFAPCGQ